MFLQIWLWYVFMVSGIQKFWRHHMHTLSITEISHEHVQSIPTSYLIVSTWRNMSLFICSIFSQSFVKMDSLLLYAGPFTRVPKDIYENFNYWYDFRPNGHWLVLTSNCELFETATKLSALGNSLIKCRNINCNCAICIEYQAIIASRYTSSTWTLQKIYII